MVICCFSKPFTTFFHMRAFYTFTPLSLTSTSTIGPPGDLTSRKRNYRCETELIFSGELTSPRWKFFSSRGTQMPTVRNSFKKMRRHRSIPRHRTRPPNNFNRSNIRIVPSRPLPNSILTILLQEIKRAPYLGELVPRLIPWNVLKLRRETSRERIGMHAVHSTLVSELIVTSN